MSNFGLMAAIGTGVTVALATITIQPVEAAIVAQPFVVDITSGQLAGSSFEGSFSYDEELLEKEDFEAISAFDGLKFSFNFLGNTYTETDDFSYPLLPQIEVFNGTLTGINYLLSRENLFISFGDGSVNDAPGKIFSYEIGAPDNLSDFGSGQLRTSVPEPSAALGMLFLGSVVFAVRRKLS